MDPQTESIVRRDNGRIPQGSNKDDLPIEFLFMKLLIPMIPFGFAASAPILSWLGESMHGPYLPQGFPSSQYRQTV
jgi:hypothetical protein